MTRILTIGGDLASRTTLARCLEPRGYRVFLAATGTEGIRLARGKRPGIVLLQRRLPDQNGLDVCKTLKGDPATGRIPIVMMMERPDAIECAVARELGAAAYLELPLTVAQLVGHIDALVGEPAHEPVASPERLGYLTLRSGEGQVTVEGAVVDLTPVELALLLVLCEGGERVHTRGELRERVWGEEGRDETRVVDQYVKRIRKKLGKAGLYIETVYGVGYRFARARAERDGDCEGERAP